MDSSWLYKKPQNQQCNKYREPIIRKNDVQRIEIMGIMQIRRNFLRTFWTLYSSVPSYYIIYSSLTTLLSILNYLLKLRTQKTFVFLCQNLGHHPPRCVIKSTAINIHSLQKRVSSLALSDASLQLSRHKRSLAISLQDHHGSLVITDKSRRSSTVARTRCGSPLSFHSRRNFFCGAPLK
ncbi:hypothetical protein KIN20_031963 [Parelaphostrongylus tenuis]|uniref:Uncharacterized protein n=1 Tax=Parelaphostrongylus tenuis TaxID=148309 RepID=A0AAD5R5X3_PARTN|nr:hypothetical protein KIN20_031963 [Parelaphostrongylus tenuis]